MHGHEDRSCRARRIHGEGQLAVVAKVDLKKERKHLYNPSAKQASLLHLAHGTSLWLTARKSQHFTRVRLSLGGTASYMRC
jgi:hypothetical protein